MSFTATSYMRKNVMLDIHSELAYWRLHLIRSAFHRTPRPFSDYVFTLKFGYDMYLLNGGCELEKMLPEMRSRYQATAMGREQLDWSLAEAVIRETWKRMHPDTDRRSFGPVLSPEVPRPASRSQRQYHFV